MSLSELHTLEVSDSSELDPGELPGVLSIWTCLL